LTIIQKSFLSYRKYGQQCLPPLHVNTVLHPGFSLCLPAALLCSVPLVLSYFSHFSSRLSSCQFLWIKQTQWSLQINHIFEMLLFS